MIETFASAAERLGWAAMLHLWHATLVFAVLAVLERLMREAPARWLSRLWWVGVAKLFLPLQLLGPLTYGLVGSRGSAEAAAVSALPTWAVATVWPVQAPAAGTAQGSLIPLSLAALWFAGMSWLVIRRVRTHRTLTPVRRGEASEYLEKLRRTARDAGVPGGTVVVTQDPSMPAVVGVLRPRIVVPRSLVLDLDAEQLRAVLLHEEAHRRRRDPLRAALLWVASTVFFFYPPLWWVVRRIRQWDEMACDEEVLRRGVGPVEYSRALARTVCLGLTPAPSPCAFVGRTTLLRRRLERLDDAGRFRTMTRHRLSLTLGIALVGIVSLYPFHPAASAKDADDVRFSEVERLSGARTSVTLDRSEWKLGDLLGLLAERGGFAILPEGHPTTLDVEVPAGKTTVGEALIALARAADLTYRVPEEKILIVRPAVLLAGMGNVSNPVVLPETQTPPVYPEPMRAAGVEGRVIMQVRIDRTGGVNDIEVLRAEPDEWGEEMEKVAGDAISQWRYDPATADGKPVDVYFTIVVEFSLDGNDDAKQEKGDGPVI